MAAPDVAGRRIAVEGDGAGLNRAGVVIEGGPAPVAVETDRLGAALAAGKGPGRRVTVKGDGSRLSGPGVVVECVRARVTVKADGRADGDAAVIIERGRAESPSKLIFAPLTVVPLLANVEAPESPSNVMVPLVALPA